VSRAAALALAVVFAWSSLGKLVTRPDMTVLGLPSWSGQATAYVEAALAVLLLVSPANGGVVALALLAGFTAFLVRRFDSGSGCACFGSSSTRPVGVTALVRNAALLVLAAMAAFA
jgi:hypothetical protein